MSEGIIVAVVAMLLAYFLSGARTFAYLFYFLGFIPFITLDATSGGLEDASNLSAPNVLFKMALRVLATAGFLVLFLRRREGFAQLCRVQAIPVLFFFSWALLSLHRAQAPFISFFRLGELLVFFVTGVVLFVESARFHPPRRVARWHCLALLQILLVTLYFEQAHPELAYFVSSDGIKRLGHKFLNSNTLGFAGVAVTLWATVELREKRPRERHVFFERVLPVLALVLALYILIGARSRSAMVTLIVGQFVLWFPFTQRESWRKPAFVLVLFGGFVLTLANFDAVAEWFLRGDSAESLKSGTGRTGLWSALLSEQLPRAPLLGAGYLMLGEHGHFFHDGSYWNNAHNTYIFSLIATGVPGFLAILIIAFLPWFVLLKRIFRTAPEDRPFWILLLSMQTVVLTASITGFGISGYPNPLMFYHYSIFTYIVTRLPAHAPRNAAAPRTSVRRPTRLSPAQPTSP